jgi:hypothetical protein
MFSKPFVFREEGEDQMMDLKMESRAGGRPEPRWWFSATGFYASFSPSSAIPIFDSR